jgi:calcineurin-like phosphoesterase family protein
MSFEARPFASVEDMNEQLINNYNSLVGEKDEVYILGDFTFGNHNESATFARRMNGKKHLVLGNHDKKMNAKLKEQFVWIKEYYELRYNHRKFVLFHYPILSWNGRFRGSIHLHGHTHTRGCDFGEVLKATPANMFNIGVDMQDFKPVSIEEILDLAKPVIDTRKK